MSGTGIITAIVAGLLFGLFGFSASRHVRVWLIVPTGIAAAFVGSLVARMFGVAVTLGVDWIELILQAGAAAVGVSVAVVLARPAAARAAVADKAPDGVASTRHGNSRTAPPTTISDVWSEPVPFTAPADAGQDDGGRLPAAGWYAAPGGGEYRQWDGRRWTGSAWTNPRTVFLSYARQDKDKVDEIARDLRSARLEVWLDEEIETGQAWWEEILTRIGTAAVFVHAVSDSSLRSEACVAERGYAEALPLPVVPVLVQDADLRSSRYGETQLVDYRVPDRARAARLIGDVMRMIETRNPLSEDSLPQPPDPPFHYLLQFAEKLRGSERIDEDGQRRLLHQIIDRRARVQDVKVRVELDDLLQLLVDRNDTLYSVARIAARELGRD